MFKVVDIRSVGIRTLVTENEIKNKAILVKMLKETGYEKIIIYFIVCV